MVPPRVDVAFQLRNNRWQGTERLQLELVALRPSGAEEVLLQRAHRTYRCRRQGEAVLICNAAGEKLLSLPDGRLTDADSGCSRPEHPYLRTLVQEAAMALGLVA